MRTKLFVFAALLMVGNCWGQVMFQRSYDISSQYNQIKAVVQTTDSGYILVGNILAIKLNQLGDTMWTRMYSDFPGEAVQQTFDGGYIIAGGYGGLFLLKINNSGDTLWTKSYNDTINSWQFKATGVFQTPDSGYIVAGSGYGDFVVIRTDSKGDTLWSKSYGTYDINQWQVENSDQLLDFQETSDGGYILAGMRIEDWNNNISALLIKIDSIGNISWSKSYTDGGFLSADFIRQTPDGGYIFYDSHSVSTSINKLDSAGNVVFSRYPGGRAIPTKDGGLAIASGNYLFKLDANDDTLWTRYYTNIYSNSITETIDSGFVLVGSPGLNISTVTKTDKEGNNNCVAFPTPRYRGNILISIMEYNAYSRIRHPRQIQFRPIISSGVTNINICNNVGINELLSSSSLTLYPNPTNNQLTIQTELTKGKLYISNTLGQVVCQSTINKSQSIDVSFFSSGIYFMRIATDEGVWTGKFLKE